MAPRWKLSTLLNQVCIVDRFLDYLVQNELIASNPVAELRRQHNIKLMAYSPLGSADSYSGASFPARGTGPFACPRGGSTLLQNEVVAEVAARHGATPAQVLIAWSVKEGFCCLPKSVNPTRIAQNLEGASLPLDDFASRVTH